METSFIDKDVGETHIRLKHIFESIDEKHQESFIRKNTKLAYIDAYALSISKTETIYKQSKPIVKQTKVLNEPRKRLDRPRKKTMLREEQLPIVPQGKRMSINLISNSSLFSAIKSKDRKMLKDSMIESMSNVVITFTGEQFNQNDYDVLMQILFKCSDYKLEDNVMISATSILQGLDRGTSGKEHEQLSSEIFRLIAGTVSIRSKYFDYVGHLIHSATRENESKQWIFQLNKELIKLFNLNMYTLIDWEQRKQLKGKDLARWLHLEIISHNKPFPLKVSTIHRLCGSNTVELYAFRQSLKEALTSLSDCNIINAWRIDSESDLVYVTKSA